MDYPGQVGLTLEYGALTSAVYAGVVAVLCGDRKYVPVGAPERRRRARCRRAACRARRSRKPHAFHAVPRRWRGITNAVSPHPLDFLQTLSAPTPSIS